jgi:hypothetical protein
MQILTAILMVTVVPPGLIAAVGAVCYWPARAWSWVVEGWW